MVTYKKLTINMSEEVHDELKCLARQRAISVTELIRRALALDKFVWEHRDSELLIKDGDSIQKIVLI